MRKKAVKKSKKKNRQKRKAKTHGKKKAGVVAMDLQKVVDFKFQTLGKIYKNFTVKRAREKEKKKNLEKKIEKNKLKNNKSN